LKNEIIVYRKFEAIFAHYFKLKHIVKKKIENFAKYWSLWVFIRFVILFCLFKFTVSWKYSNFTKLISEHRKKLLFDSIRSHILLKKNTVQYWWRRNSLFIFSHALFYRLFYAGACEGQMPQILTMIQINRLTPTPAVICIVIKLMNYYYIICVPNLI